MRDLRCFSRNLLCCALASATVSAHAQLLVATTPGDPPAVGHAELAYAGGVGLPVTWLSLRIQRGPVALIAALPEDAVAEPALDAWLAALEITASPNVLLPSGASGCKEGSSFVHVSWPRSSGTAEVALKLTSGEDVQAALDAQGLALDSPLPQAPRYLVWSWAAANREQTTRTLRIVGGEAPLAFAPGATFPVLVSALTRGPVAFPNELQDEELRVTFTAGEHAETDYRERLRDWVGVRAEPLLEMRARGPIFDWSIYGDQVSIMPLVQTYAQRAADEVLGLDGRACTEQLRALRSPDAPAATACGEARDAELALSATGTEQVTLQRFALAGSSGLFTDGGQGGGEPSAPLLRAERWDGTRCVGAPTPVGVPEPPLSSDGSQGTGSPGTTTVVVEETVYVDETPRPEVGCGSSTRSEQGYYAGDRTDGCSSDSSSSASSSDDSCSSDSSSSTSSGDDSCSSDSSSSSDDSDGSGCDGSSDSGYDGDTCTASAAPGRERTGTARAGLSAPGVRPKRLKLSLWSVGFAAAMLPIRRRKRRL